MGGRCRSARAALAAAAVCASFVVTTAVGGAANPAKSVTPKPNYPNHCAPAGLDTSSICLRLTLAAIDAARAREGVRPMRLPADFAQLTPTEQLFVAIDAERVDRGLAPFVGMTAALDRLAQAGANRASLPARPTTAGYRRVELEWIGDVSNGLDADYQWMYFDGPGSGVPDCGQVRHSGCWIDRRILLDPLGPAPDLVMGVAVDASVRANDGGSSVAAILTLAKHPSGPYVFTWAQARAATQGVLRPLAALPAGESDSGIADPPGNVAPKPDYLAICAPRGLDRSSRCTDAVLAALNRAHALEGVPPMVLPTNFSRLSVAEQLFVAIDLERVDRGLPPFVGMTAALDRNAQAGADRTNDPPDPGPNYLLFDGEWAGGSANALDAVYGWMYNDGFNSGNLDCPHPGAAGCWGHRKGILDDFGSGADLVMGAAIKARGVKDAPSVAATLAVAATVPRHLRYTWADVIAAMPPGAQPG